MIKAGFVTLTHFQWGVFKSPCHVRKSAVPHLFLKLQCVVLLHIPTCFTMNHTMSTAKQLRTLLHVARNHLCMVTLWWDIFNLHRLFLSPLALERTPRWHRQCWHFLAYLSNCGDNPNSFACLKSSPEQTLTCWFKAQAETISNVLYICQCVQDIAPQFSLSPHCTVSKTVNTFLWTGQNYTDVIWNVEKANLTFRVAWKKGTRGKFSSFQYLVLAGTSGIMMDSRAGL